MELNTPYPQIPYGWADFEAMRREHTLYVDKTRFLHELFLRHLLCGQPISHG